MCKGLGYRVTGRRPASLIYTDEVTGRMSVTWSWWSALAVVPYVIQAANHPYGWAVRGWLQRNHLPARRVLATAVTAALLLTAAPVVWAQQQQPSRQRGQQRNNGTRQNPAQVPIVAGDFQGTLRSLERKKLRLDVNEDQNVEFVRDHKTKFLRGDQEIDAKDLPVGTRVTVEATKHPSGDLVALRVIVKP